MSTPSSEGVASRLGIIILGASTFPQFPKGRRLDNQSFARSAAAFRDLISSPGISLAGTPLLLDLFDSAEPPLDIIRRIRDFLSSTPLTDVLIYYCGHGDFLPDAHKTYYLVLKATEPDNEAFTALPLRQARLSLDLQLVGKRVFLVLDCCFAGQALTEWQSDGIGSVVEEQLFQVFPRRGTALIAASAKGLPALAPGSEPLTMFTGALVQTISEGLAGHGPQLSFRDVFTATRTRIINRYGQRAAIPAIHAPQQQDGDISFDPFFVNHAFKAEPSAAETEYFDLAKADLNRPLINTRVGALESLRELLEKTKSPAFKAKLIAKLQATRDNDDSSTVRDKAAAILAAAATNDDKAGVMASRRSPHISSVQQTLKDVIFSLLTVFAIFGVFTLIASLLATPISFQTAFRVGGLLAAAISARLLLYYGRGGRMAGGALTGLCAGYICNLEDSNQAGAMVIFTIIGALAGAFITAPKVPFSLPSLFGR